VPDLNDAAQFIVEPPDFFVSHLPAGHQASAPHLIELDGGTSAWSFEGGAFTDPVGLEVAAARQPGTPLRRSYRYDDLAPAATLAKARIAAMDLDGIAKASVFPTYGLNVVNIRDNELHRESVRAYNDAVAQWCEEGDAQRLLPQALIPSTGLDDALRELDRVIGLGFRGVVLTGWPSAERIPAPADDQFWARCAESQMVLSIVRGGTTVSQREVRPTTPAALGRYAGVSGGAGELPPMDVLITDLVLTKNNNLTWLILTGVLERFPQLKVLLVQSGSGWLPTCGELIDWNYRYAQFVPGNGFAKLKDLPSDYLRRQTFVTVEGDQPEITYLHERDAADKVLWASGFPTSISSWGHSQERAAEQIHGLDDRLRDGLLRDNFDALYAPAAVRAGV
jgi:uncharacterized protein